MLKSDEWSAEVRIRTGRETTQAEAIGMLEGATGIDVDVESITPVQTEPRIVTQDM